MESEKLEIQVKKGEICMRALRVPKAPDCKRQRHLLPRGVWGHAPLENFFKMELKYEVSCIFRHVYSKENDRVPQQILYEKLKTT